jgi:hypothetical protein
MKLRLRRRGWIALLFAPALALTMLPVTASAMDLHGRRHSHNGDHVARATVTGPVTGGTRGFAFDASALPLSAYGYTEQEYFLSGTASSYTTPKALASDGRWKVKPASTAAYKTRLLVRKPTDPAKFNGTVIVEWLNVSVGFDTAPDWNASHEQFMRDGYAYIGVSAQDVGVNGFPPGDPRGNQGMKAWDPARYGSLVHPGDSFSYDIYSQAGKAIRDPHGANPLNGLRIKSLIADGESQSAFRMVTYINAVARVADVYDAYLVHSRGASGAPLSQAPQPTINAPSPELFRTDLAVPVMVFESESDLMTLGYYTDRQPDSRWIRDWETPGTSHADHYMLAYDTLDIQKSWPDSKPSQCDKPINDGPMRYVLDAAYVALDKWVRHGTPAPHAPRIDVVPGATPTLKLDALGNATGGIRTPDVDVPRNILSGLGNAPANFCQIFGTTTPLSAATLNALYPNTADYMNKVSVAAQHAVASGFLLNADVQRIVAEAANTKDPTAGV